MDIPLYSKCCHESVLGDINELRLYCYRCNKTIRSFKGARRLKALSEMEFQESRCRVDVILCGQRIAYARDVPNLELVDGQYRKVGRSKYKYFVQGCSLVSAMGWQQCKTEDGFASLSIATDALRKVLV